MNVYRSQYITFKGSACIQFRAFSSNQFKKGRMVTTKFQYLHIIFPSAIVASIVAHSHTPHACTSTPKGPYHAWFLTLLLSHMVVIIPHSSPPLAKTSALFVGSGTTWGRTRWMDKEVNWCRHTFCQVQTIHFPIHASHSLLRWVPLNKTGNQTLCEEGKEQGSGSMQLCLWQAGIRCQQTQSVVCIIHHS